MNLSKKKIYLGLFAVLYLCVAFVSTLHAIAFFSLANETWLGIILACTFEIGQAAVLFSILTNKKNENKIMPWCLMVVLTLVQVLGNVFSSYKYIMLNSVVDLKYFKEPIFVWTNLPDDITTVIVTYIIGAILPIVALCLTSMVTGYLDDEESTETPHPVIEKPIDEKTEEIEVKPIEEQEIHEQEIPLPEPEPEIVREPEPTDEELYGAPEPDVEMPIIEIPVEEEHAQQVEETKIEEPEEDGTETNDGSSESVDSETSGELEGKEREDEGTPTQIVEPQKIEEREIEPVNYGLVPDELVTPQKPKKESHFINL